MKIAVNAKSLLTGAFEAAPRDAETTLKRTGGPEEAFQSIAALGMRRGGTQAVRVSDGAGLALAISAYFHGAFRVSREAVRRFGGDVFAARDALCDYGEGLLVLDCAFGAEASAVRRALELARCEGYARMLGALPANFLNLRAMAAYLQSLAAARGLSCQIFDAAALREMGCGGILAVGQGSGACALAVLQCGAPRTALIGKGVLFDSGGYHLKSADAMRGMQYDMCGAAVVAQALEYKALAGEAEGLLAVLPLAENVLGPDAVKMGDVIRTLGGITVEVDNPDAEGRLLLCDALAYAARAGAKKLLDAATLTYGAQAALGDETAAYFCNDAALAAAWEAAAEQTGEPVWRMPLHPRYLRALSWSQCADLANYAPGYGATACTAAAFLERFVPPGVPWLHLDAVGPSVRRGRCDWECPGPRGFGLRTLARWLK